MYMTLLLFTSDGGNVNDIQSRCCKVQSIKNFFRKAIYLAKFDMSKSNTFTAQNYCTPHVMLLTPTCETLNMIQLFVIKLQGMSEVIFF
jgi:hypothetical protein